MEVCYEVLCYVILFPHPTDVVPDSLLNKKQKKQFTLLF
jgi:hypothetical protein